jgi:hypothetical protein
MRIRGQVNLIESLPGQAPIYSYEAFRSELGNSTNTPATLNALRSFDWLPAEGSDFNIQFRRREAGIVALEAESYFPGDGPRVFLRK